MIALLLALAAWGATPEETVLDALQTADYASVADDAGLSDEALEALAEHPDWRVRVQAMAALSARRDPALAATVASAQPSMSRAGVLRFADPALVQDAAVPLMVDRLVHGGDDAQGRAAIVDMLRRTRGDWTDAVVALIPAEPDPWARAAMVAALEKAPGASAMDGIRAAAADPAAQVRAAAMRAVGGRSDGAEQADIVLAGLSDPEPQVRADAAQAAGWRHIAAAWAPLVGLLADRDASVRLRALRGLQKLDPAQAAHLPLVDALCHDPDPKVQAAARSIRGQ